MRKIDKIIKDIFGETKLVYPVRGIALKKHRTALGVSRKEFARLCGWPLVFQTGLEEPRRSRRYLSFFERDKIVAIMLILSREKNLKRTSKSSLTPAYTRS